MDPCADCKEHKKIYANRMCSKCYGKHSMRRYRKLNIEKDRKRKRDWYQKHKEEFCLVRKRSRILKKYNLTLKEYEEIKNQQKKECKICHIVKDLVLDHDHKNGNIRSMLCDSCNRGLGYFADDPKLLVSAAEYLIEHKNNIKFQVTSIR